MKSSRPSRLSLIIFGIVFCYAAICVVLAVVLTEIAFRPSLVHVYNLFPVTSRLGIDLQNVAVTSIDGIKLHAWFAQPSNANGDSVILLHGVGDTRQAMLGFARIFLSSGYAVLMPDSRGHGESGGIPTYGIKEADDLARWYGWLKSSNNPGCVYGLGESMGAAILLQSANRVPFCAIAAESPFASFREIAYIRVGQIFGMGSWLGKTLLRPTVELAFLYGRLTRGVWLSNASPEKSVAKSWIPTLLIHGMADTNIPLQQSEKIRAQNQAAVVLWKVPNAGHCGASAVAGREFAARVVGWFASHRKKLQ